jgi:hypothetical protein
MVWQQLCAKFDANQPSSTEEAFQSVGPAVTRRGVLVAAFFQGLVQLAQQSALVLAELDRRFHRDVAVQVARVAGAHALDALAAQAELLAGLGAFGMSMAALPPSVGTSISPPSVAVHMLMGT